MRTLLDAVLRVFVRLILGVFFRRVEILGWERLPDGGGTIYVGNHGNSLIDPALAVGWLPRGIRFLAKSTLWRHPVIAPFVRLAGAVPVYRHRDTGADTSRNREMFARCFALLEHGGSIGLFPEGISHSEPQLQPLKTGAARIALGTLQAAPQANVRIVPFGLHFEDRTRFRSAALIEIGTSIDPRPILTTGGADDRQAVLRLTSEIERALRRVTVGYESWEEAHLIRRAASLFGRDETSRSGGMAGNVEYQRAFAQGYGEIKARHPAETADLRQALRAYDRRLTVNGLTDTQVAASYPRQLVVRFVFRHLVDLLILLPVGLLGTLINWLPYRLPGWIVRLLPPSEDLRATYKVMGSIILFPVFWTLIGHFAWTRWGTGAGLAAAVLCPLSGYAALLLKERLRRLMAESRAYLILNWKPSLAADLRTRRRELLEQIRDLVTAYRRAGGSGPT